jgi:hypothetical protein
MNEKKNGRRFRYQDTKLDCAEDLPLGPGCVKELRKCVNALMRECMNEEKKDCAEDLPLGPGCVKE